MTEKRMRILVWMAGGQLIALTGVSNAVWWATGSGWWALTAFAIGLYLLCLVILALTMAAEKGEG